MVKQPTASVTTQLVKLVALSVKTHSGGGGGKKTRNEESAARIARVYAL